MYPVISTAKCYRSAVIYKLCDASMLWFLLLIISYKLQYFFPFVAWYILSKIKFSRDIYF